MSLLALSLCAVFTCRTPALGEEALGGRAEGKGAFYIEVQNGSGAHIAGAESKAAAAKANSKELVFEREYQPGDRILFGGAQWMAVKLDESMPECMVYIPDSAQGKASYEIPYGREEKQTGSAYAPESFAGKSHRVTVRAWEKKERSGYRNLALNPCDARETEQAPAQFFPHATTNSVSRSLFDFEARNAIDGITQNGHHGVWPYQSWGPQLRLDLWWKVDFGRPVELDKVRLMARSDFPHDSYWKSADVEFSDGTHVAIQIAESGEFQEFSFPKRRVSWMRLNHLAPADPARWCALIEVEAWGRDWP